MTELFQTSLLGYSKKSVCAYIAEMNEEFSKKLLEKDMARKDAVQTLQEQLEQLKRENEQLRAERREVAGALIDAKAFAAGLIERAEEENRAQCAKNKALCQAELRRLQAMAADIDALRAAFCATLRDMDAELEQYRLRCRTAQAELVPETPEDGEAPWEEESAAVRPTA